MRRWKPIETAPTDGTPVDLWIEREDGTGFRATDAIFCDVWVIPVNETGDAREGYSGKRKVTHWMLIPPGPDGEGSLGGR